MDRVGSHVRHHFTSDSTGGGGPFLSQSHIWADSLHNRVPGKHNEINAPSSVETRSASTATTVSTAPSACSAPTVGRGCDEPRGIPEMGPAYQASRSREARLSSIVQVNDDGKEPRRCCRTATGRPPPSRVRSMDLDLHPCMIYIKWHARASRRSGNPVAM